MKSKQIKSMELFLLKEAIILKKRIIPNSNKSICLNLRNHDLACSLLNMFAKRRHYYE